MIKGAHLMLYSPKAEELRAFMRDKLGFPFTDVHDGWLIFDLPEADLGCHPSDKVFHEVSFYCDDIHQTVAQLKEWGVEFTSDVRDMEWGWVTTFRMPGDAEVMLYQPKYVKAKFS